MSTPVSELRLVDSVGGRPTVNGWKVFGKWYPQANGMKKRKGPSPKPCYCCGATPTTHMVSVRSWHMRGDDEDIGICATCADRPLPEVLLLIAQVWVGLSEHENAS